MEKENFNRRDFLKTSLKSIAVGSIAIGAIGGFDVKKLIAETESDSSISAPKVLNLSDYPDLASVGGSIMIGKTYVEKTGNGKFLALNTLCTHKRCDVDKTDEGFECPCHGSTYSKTGKVTNGPATKNLKSYKTTYKESENTLTINM